MPWRSGERHLRLRVLIARALCGDAGVLHTDLGHDVLLVTPQGLVGDLLGTDIDVLDVTNFLGNIYQIIYNNDSQQ